MLGRCVVSMGVMVSEIIVEVMIESDIMMLNLFSMCFMILFMSRIGRNIVISESDMDMIVVVILLLFLIVVLNGFMFFLI